mmetsp:Transcript_2929/g.2507  ORF Transcript_2929/g.2507 Transcript_2929/m.2507 type:complete len:85 (+) Transcript_2929:80-334(+)
MIFDHFETSDSNKFMTNFTFNNRSSTSNNTAHGRDDNQTPCAPKIRPQEDPFKDIPSLCISSDYNSEPNSIDDLDAHSNSSSLS